MINLEYTVQPSRTEDGERFEKHVLVDTFTSRCIGQINGPIAGESWYKAIPEFGDERWYRDLDAAKAYLDESAMLADMQDSVKFCDFMIGIYKAKKPRVKKKVAV